MRCPSVHSKDFSDATPREGIAQLNICRKILRLVHVPTAKCIAPLIGGDNNGEVLLSANQSNFLSRVKFELLHEVLGLLDTTQATFGGVGGRGKTFRVRVPGLNVSASRALGDRHMVSLKANACPQGSSRFGGMRHGGLGPNEIKITRRRLGRRRRRSRRLGRWRA
jgi:hypothetical protein